MRRRYTQDRQCTYNVTLRRNSCNHSCRGKAISIIYSECVFVALVIQLAKRMRRIILTSVACPALPHFCTLSHKWHDFRGKKLFNIKCVCVDFHYNIHLKDFSFSEEFIDILSQIPVIFVRFSWNYDFLYTFSKIFSNTKFHENPSIGSRVVTFGWADWQIWRS